MTGKGVLNGCCIGELSSPGKRSLMVGSSPSDAIIGNDHHRAEKGLGREKLSRTATMIVDGDENHRPR
jgi:hypothetical protein